MLKQKVVIKSKKTQIPVEPMPKKRGRPATKAPKSIQGSSPASRVYNLSSVSKIDMPKKTYVVNNVVQLTITIRDIKLIEEELSKSNDGLLNGINQSSQPTAWNANSENIVSSLIPVTDSSNAFKTLIKRSNVNLTSGDSENKVNRKDLIINSGVKRHTRPIMQIYSHGWPAHTTYSCWYDCNKFNTTPVGIPQLLHNMEFHCYGNFCSYNCAKRYLRPYSEDDLAMLQTTNDVAVNDDLGEKLQLLELLYHIETGAPFDQPIKLAPRRLSLAMFGGNKTIEEFRNNFATHDSYHVFRSPLVPISYQMEECSNKIARRQKQRVSLDTLKIERAFNELAEKAIKHKTGLKKLMRT